MLSDRLRRFHPLRQLTALVFTTTLLAGTAQADDATTLAPQHGISMHGDLKYPADFTHFDYTNPEAPKGGSVTRAAIGTFDNFNPFIIKGTAADGVGLIYDTLMSQAEDEPFSEYGLLAKSVTMPEDRRWVEFELRPEARFSDGKPVTAEDVVFTFNALRKFNPFYGAYYADISAIKALSPHRVRFEFADTQNRELPLIVGQVPILPKHYWENRTFDAVNLDIPVGSGPYSIKSFEAGRSVTFARNKSYWGKDLPVNKGRYNFDQIKYDYYGDSTVALEAFKAGDYDFRLENTAKAWATAYTGSNFDSGKIIKQALPNHNPTGMQAFVMNTRRDLFKDPKVRQALGYAFDFEWTNKNLFYGAYTRTNSYFSNSEMAATELPTVDEKALLEKIKDKVPPQVFTQVYKAPKTRGDGNIRPQLRKAFALLREAGWSMKNGVLTNADGKPFRFEILLVQKEFERVVQPFISNLKRLGIQADIRLVDASQFINRKRQFDYDMMVWSFGQSNSPGNEQRDFWYSTSADQPGSSNVIGIKNPAVDYLVDRIIQAKDRRSLVIACRALDRVLQWNYYVIPQYHTTKWRIAYWNKFERPKTMPLYNLGFDTWWIKR